MTTILRSPHDQNHPYLSLVRGVAQNKAMSYEALGMLTYLLSKPDDWVISIDDLMREGCGRNRVYSILKELKKAGHLQQEREQATQGHPPQWGSRRITESPFPANGDYAPYADLRDTAKADTAKADTAKADTVNSRLQIIEQDTNQRNTQNTERDAPAPVRESTHVPFSTANGLGFVGRPGLDSPLVLAIKAHPVFKAFALGWDGIEPEIVVTTADITFDAVKILQADVDSGATTYQEIQDITRWKLSDKRTRGYRVDFVKVDTPAYRAWKRNQDAPAKPQNTDATPPPAAPAPAAASRLAAALTQGIDVQAALAHLAAAPTAKKGDAES